MNLSKIKIEDSDEYLFLRELFFDLIIFFLKRKDKKSVDQLQQGWKETEAQYTEISPCG
jgi:hypothetical protein